MGSRRADLRGRAGRAVALAGAALLAAAPACAPGAPPPREAPRASTDGALARTLARLADQALARGDLDVAQGRYERWLARDPRAAEALVGLGRVALARGAPSEAERRFRAALAVEPDAAEAWLGLAEVAADPAERRARLERALAAAPELDAAHARLAELTGRAPHRARTLEEATALAERHPYDPRVLVDLGGLLAGAGRGEEARVPLETALALADLDPPAAVEAAERLAALSPAWTGRRLVPVHVYADAALRARPGWRFRQRRLWTGLSAALDPLLHTRFAVAGFGALDAPDGGPALAPRLARLMRETASRPAEGLVAGFTAEPRPRYRGARRGLADYMGRHLLVRDVPDDPVERVLAHEVLHVYGAIHVVDDLESLMSPAAPSLRIDPLNAAIVAALASRSFGPGGVEAEVLPRIDLDEACDAFERALGVNLTFRELGLDALLGDATRVGPGAWSQVQRVERLDHHLADVSRFVARLYWEAGRRVQAVALLETSARLYGLDTPRGRETFARAQTLRRYLKAALGVP